MKTAILILSILPFLFIACSKNSDELLTTTPAGIDEIVIPESKHGIKIKHKGDDATTPTAVLSCTERYLELGMWERTQTLDSLGNPMTNMGYWGLGSSDTLIFSTDTTMYSFLNQDGFQNIYTSPSQLNAAVHYGDFYKFDEANCTLDVGMLSCGIAMVRYNIVQLTANSLTLEAETDVTSLNNAGGHWFMASDPHTIIFTKIP